MTLRPKTRKLLVATHVLVSAAALGLYLTLLVLAVAGLRGGERETMLIAYKSMDIFGDWLIIPINLLVLVSGLVLGIGTKWGLVRYYWVATKLLLTLGLATASIFGLRARIAEAVGAADTLPTGALSVGGIGIVLVVLVPVALAIYGTTTVLSVYKPWGMTKRGKRLRPAR
jgi:hypothetical protein